MKQIKTPIIPYKPTFVKIKEKKHELDYKAICIFSALGFFLDTDTYWLDEKVLPPASINQIDEDGYWISSEPWFKWYYKPQNISLEKATDKFQELFEKIVKEQSLNKKVILPLSGGLDSRSQAVALKKLNASVASYSYSFQNGFKESEISKKIAKKCDFPFKEFVIKKSYLWDKLNDLSQINKCYSEFTHPRQMAVIDDIASLGNTFSLGHWGDVLFDSDKYDETLNNQELLQILNKKVIKKGGLELAIALWDHWNLEGNFESYLNKRVLKLLSTIDIENSNSKLRAFKSMYWAPRWTSVNLSIFENKHSIDLPYYDDRMCKFICEIPEELLADRQIQIEYIKKNNSDVAKIVWQDAKPFNLFNHHLAKTPYSLPYKLVNKVKREFNTFLGKKFIQRNWELQFLGYKNQEELKKYLSNVNFCKEIDPKIFLKFLDLFNHKDGVYYSHSVSMLLTLSVFLSNTEYEKN